MAIKHWIIRLPCILLVSLVLQGCKRSAEDYLSDGHAFESANQPEEAEALFREGIKAYPEDYSLSTAMLNLYVKSEQWEKVDKYIRIAPVDRLEGAVVASAERGLAKRLFAEHRWSDAATQFFRAGERTIINASTQQDHCPLLAIEDYRNAGASAVNAGDDTLLFTISDRLTVVTTTSACQPSSQTAINDTFSEVDKWVKNARRPKPEDWEGWKSLLTDAVKQNMAGVKSNRPYVFLVPSGSDSRSVAERNKILDTLQHIVAAGVLPGNMLAFGGASSRTTADLVVRAFDEAALGSFKSVVVLFIGDRNESHLIEAALRLSEAEFRFVEM